MASLPTSPSRSAARDRLPRDVQLVSVVIILGAMASILSTTAVSVAFDDLGRELDAGLDTVQWVATGYILGLAAMIATTGWLARRIGVKRLYLWSLALFSLTSVLCALATSIEALIAFRVIAGVAGGATLPVGQMALASAAGPDRMGRVMAFVGVPMLLAPVIGPSLGGLLLEQLSWHWIFLMNLPPSLAALALGVWLLPATPTRSAGPFDLSGFLYLSLGAPVIVYGLARSVAAGSFDASAVVPIVIGLLLIAGFVRHAWDAEHPLLDVRLWSNRAYAACSTTALFVSASLFGTLVLFPSYFQHAHGAGPLESGLLVAPLGLGTALSMTFAGRLTDRVGGGLVALGGISVLAATTVPLVFAGPGMPYWALLLLLGIRGLGAGASLMPAYAAVFANLDRSQLPDATPQINLVQRLGQSFGTAILSVIVAGQLAGATGQAAAADAYGHMYVIATGISALGLIPAAALAIIERGRPTRTADAVRVADPPEPTIA